MTLELVHRALLWLRPEPVAGGGGAGGADGGADDESDEEALRAYPSIHTCLACNIVGAVDLLRRAQVCRCSVVPSTLAIQAYQSNLHVRGDSVLVVSCNLQVVTYKFQLTSYNLLVSYPTYKLHVRGDLVLVVRRYQLRDYMSHDQLQARP